MAPVNVAKLLKFALLVVITVFVFSQVYGYFLLDYTLLEYGAEMVVPSQVSLELSDEMKEVLLIEHVNGVCSKQMQAPRPNRWSESFPFRVEQHHSTPGVSHSSTLESFESLRLAVNEDNAALNCPVIGYDSTEFPLKSTTITNGPTLVWFNKSLGEAATLFLNPKCMKTKVKFRQAMKKEWTHLDMSDNRLKLIRSLCNPFSCHPPTLAAQEFHNYQSLGFALGDLLCGDVYTWISCEGMGSQLLITPPVMKEGSYIPPHDSESDAYSIRHLVDASKVSAKALPLPDSPEHSSTPLVDTFVSLLFDALAREKMPYSFPALTDFLKNAEKDPKCTHFAVPLRRYSSVGSNSPPNKLALYAGTTFEDFNEGGGRTGTDWLFDVAAAEGFAVSWFDEGIDNKDNTRNGNAWTVDHDQSYLGDMQFWYSQRPGRVIGDYAWPTAAQADNLMPKWNDKTLVEPVRSAPSMCEIKGPVESFPSSLYFPRHYPVCPGNVALYEHGIDYLDSFLKLNRGMRRAGFATFLESHITQAAFPSFDKEVAEKLRQWTSEGSEAAMGNSAMFVWGDHGFHYMTESTTSSGRSAHKQPAGWLLLPKAWAVTNPDMYSALIGNAASLVSHFDMHMTLRHILTGSKEVPVSNNEPLEEKDVHVFNLVKEKGVTSLLSAPFTDANRTCTDAGVPTAFCPCHILECSKDLNENDAIAKRLEVFAQKVNDAFVKAEVDDICAPMVAGNRDVLTEEEYGLKIEGGCEMTVGKDGKINLSISVVQKEWNWKWRVPVTISEKGDPTVAGAFISQSQWGPHFEKCIPKFLKKFGLESKQDLLTKTGVNSVKDFCYCE